MNPLNLSVSVSLRRVGVGAAVFGVVVLSFGQMASAQPPRGRHMDSVTELKRQAEPPLGSRSFLSRHVHSVTELRRQLDKDPRLIRIYSELLHMSPAEVRAEFARLRLVKLSEEGVYKVYGVFETPNGLQYSFKVRRLPKGIDVFTLEDGATPVILKQCGNLLRGYYTTPGPIADAVPAFNEVNPDAGLAHAPGPSPESVTLESPVGSEWGWVEDTASAGPLPTIVPPPGLSPAVRAAWWPWLFPLIGLPFIGVGGGGSGGGGSTFGPFPLFVPPTLASTASSSALAAVVLPEFDVPEPGGIGLLVSLSATGAGLLLWHMRRTAKRRPTRS
jgi:hypothetical protein